MGAALRVFSGDGPSTQTKSSGLTDRALAVLGGLKTIAADRVDAPVQASLGSIAAVCGKTQTKTRGALLELARAGLIGWEPATSFFVVHAGASHACARRDVARTPRATRHVVACTTHHDAAGAGASKERATPVARILPPSSNQEKSLVLENQDGGTRVRGALACEESQTELPFTEPQPSGPELAKVAALAMDLGGDVYWGVFVDRMARVGYSAQWIREAVVCAAARSKLRPEYIHGILKGYQRDGGPPKAPQQAAPQTARKPPTLEAPRQSPEARQRTIDYLNSRINRKGGRP